MTERNKFIIGLILLAAAIVIGVWQYNEMEALKLSANLANTDAANLSNEKSDYEKRFEELKGEVNEIRSSSSLKSAEVFPTTEDITGLTRLFDDFAVKNNFSSNPFFISNINYQEAELSEDSSYRFVPLSLSLESSKKNLSKFIEFLESSGSFEGEVRLMSIEDMSISYPTEYGGTYNAEFTIYAYFSQEI